MKVFVMPSWFPPNGGSFFLEQSIVLNEITEQIVLYVEPMSIKTIIKNPFMIKKLFSIQEEVIKDLKIIRVSNLRVPKLLLINLFLENFKYRTLYNYAVKKYGKPDLLHVHSSIWNGWYAYNLKQKYNIPYIITEHRGRYVDNRFARLENQLPESYNNRLKLIFNNASCISPVSNAMTEKIKFYSDNLNIQPIPNLLNEDLFFYKEIEKNKKFTFITVAGLTTIKGIDILIKSFKEVLNNNHKCQLIIIGTGTEKNKLDKLIQKLNIENNVFFIGHQNRKDVAKYMRESHVFVLPTRYEAFGVVFIEALSVGLPVIATKKSGGPDSIVNSKNGLLIEIDNIKELSEAMLTIQKNYRQYNLKDIALDTKIIYGKKNFKNSYLKIYKGVVNAN